MWRGRYSDMPPTSRMVWLVNSASTREIGPILTPRPWSRNRLFRKPDDRCRASTAASFSPRRDTS